MTQKLTPDERLDRLESAVAHLAQDVAASTMNRRAERRAEIRELIAEADARAEELAAATERRVG